MQYDPNNQLREKCYLNQGNKPLLELLDSSCEVILDVGCGSGNNAELLKALGRNIKVYGITLSHKEFELASSRMEGCWVKDIEDDNFDFLKGLTFDAIIFSHVLEHLRNPVSVLLSLCHYLRLGGIVLIALPNVVYWKNRWDVLRGRFEYTTTGILDQSHLRFFTYHTASQSLVPSNSGLTQLVQKGDGRFPLSKLRRLFPSLGVCADRLALKLFPNLFSFQILIKLKKSEH